MNAHGGTEEAFRGGGGGWIVVGWPRSHETPDTTGATHTWHRRRTRNSRNDILHKNAHAYTISSMSS